MEEVELDIVEQYANTDNLQTALVVVGFDSSRNAYQKHRDHIESEDWTDWIPSGSAVDYEDNVTFANLSGCPFKIDNA